MKAFIDNKSLLDQIQEGMLMIRKNKNNPLVWEPFYNDFVRRFCWASNHLEGNTLSLDETIEVIDYDEVRSGHSFTEYQEAKNLYMAIDLLSPGEKVFCDGKWLKEVNGVIMGVPKEDAAYRKRDVYIGTLVEAVYYPPKPEEVEGLMETFIKRISTEPAEKSIEWVAENHILFERIHPFQDGNGRTGRMLLNQQLMNFGYLPVSISNKGKYRQAFRIYERKKDTSLMVHLIGKELLASIKRVETLAEKAERRNTVQLDR